MVHKEVFQYKLYLYAFCITLFIVSGLTTVQSMVNKF